MLAPKNVLRHIGITFLGMQFIVQTLATPIEVINKQECKALEKRSFSVLCAAILGSFSTAIYYKKKENDQHALAHELKKGRKSGENDTYNHGGEKEDINNDKIIQKHYDQKSTPDKEGQKKDIVDDDKKDIGDDKKLRQNSGEKLEDFGGKKYRVHEGENEAEPKNHESERKQIGDERIITHYNDKDKSEN